MFILPACSHSSFYPTLTLYANPNLNPNSAMPNNDVKFKN